MSGARKALIIATGRYDHPSLQQLQAPAADAARLAGVLGDPTIGNFNVDVIRDREAREVSAQVEDLFAEAKFDDVLLLHFSCHGLKSESGHLFFAARDTKPNRLGSSAVSADFVQQCLRLSRCRSVVLLLDCCYGGAFGQGVTVRASGDVHVLENFPADKLGGGRGRAVITASSAMEYAFEGDRLTKDHSQTPSVFTRALVDGLSTGEADRDEDGTVSLNELYDYVYDRVREVNPHQTPSRDIEMSGDFYIAHSRRRRIRPTPLPSDLQAALNDQNMFTRIGAVTELRFRLLADNLPAAAGAYEALATTARDDIKHVSDAARTALDEARLVVERATLDFGQVAIGSEPAPRVLAVDGPPLACTYSIGLSDDWIAAEQTDEGLIVTVATKAPGSWRGEITLSAATGEVVIVSVVVTVASAAIPQPPPRESTLPPVAGRTSTDEARPESNSGPPGLHAPRDEKVPTRRRSPFQARNLAPSRRKPKTSEGALPREGHWAIAAGVPLLLGVILSDLSLMAPSATWIGIAIVSFALAAGGGVLANIDSTRHIGRGMALGALATFIWWPVFLFSGESYYHFEGRTHLLTLVATAFLLRNAVLTRRLYGPEARIFQPRFPTRPLAWIIIAVGVGGCVSLAIFTVSYSDREFLRAELFLPSSLYLMVMTICVPVYVAVATPNRLGAGILAAWAVGACSIFYLYDTVDFDAAAGDYALLLFAISLAAEFFLAVILGWRSRSFEGPSQGPRNSSA